MTTPVTVTITGGAGAIGYALAFRIANGDVYGPDVPVKLNLLEVPDAMRAAEGVAMELDDSAFPLLSDVNVYDNAKAAFEGTHMAALVGARPRTKGMERADLLEANGAIFGPQGEALNEHADDDVRVLVIGNPANTNAAIVAAHAPRIAPNRISALMRLDHNRAISKLAKKARVLSSDVTRLTIWGNHSAKQFPDVFNALIEGQPAIDRINDMEWITNKFIPKVANRGTEIIEARGASSAASAASASIDHMRDWVQGTPDGDLVSVALPSDGSYRVPEGLVSSFPVQCVNGEFQIVQGLELGSFAQERLAQSVWELEQERLLVGSFGFLP